MDCSKKWLCMMKKFGFIVVASLFCVLVSYFGYGHTGFVLDNDGTCEETGCDQDDVDSVENYTLSQMLVKREMRSLHPSLQTGDWTPMGCFKEPDGAVMRIDCKKGGKRNSGYRLSVYRKGSDLLGRPDVCLMGTLDVQGTIQDHIFTFKGRHMTYEVDGLGVESSLRVFNGKKLEKDCQLTQCYWLDLIKDGDLSVPLVYGGMKGLKDAFYVKLTDDATWQLWYDDRQISLDNDFMDEGVPEMDAFASPDGRYVYVICNIMANGNSMNSYFVYRVDSHSLEVEFINSGADACRVADGIKVVVARCVNPDAECNAYKRYKGRDVIYGFDGKIKYCGRERKI